MRISRVRKNLAVACDTVERLLDFDTTPDPMLEKREVRLVPGGRRSEIWTKVWEWWGRQGFQLSQSGPFRVHGLSFYARIGLRREIDLFVDEVKDGCSLDLTFRAQPTEEGIIVGAVAAVVLLPVAVVGGALSYTEYESDARNLILAFWQVIAPPGGKTSGIASPPLPPPCQGCGSALLPDWRVCPYCGRPKDA